MLWNNILLQEGSMKALRMDYTALVATATPDCDITNFPRAMITVRGGIVVKTVEILDSPICKLPDMCGWYVEDLLEWVNNEDIPGPLNMIAWR